MNKIQNKVNKLIFHEFILILFIIIGNILKLPSLVSLLFSTTFIILLVEALLELWEAKINRYHVLIVFIIIAVTIINVIADADNLSFNYFKKAFIFISTVIFFYLALNIEVNKKTVEFILKINLLIAAIYPFTYFIIGIKTRYANGLTFNFSNPNLTAMYIFHSILYCSLGFVYYKKIIVKGMIGILAVLLVYFLNETLSRGCLVALVFFLGLCIVNSLTSSKIKVNRGISFILLIAPLMIPILYMKMVESGLISIFTFAESEGKTLTSRYEIWNRAFNSIHSNLVLGNYYGLSDGSGMSQMHNTHLDVLASYGVIVFVLFIIILNIITKKINNDSKSILQKNSMFAFYSVIIMGTFEASLVSGGVGLYILSGGFLVLGKYLINE